MPIIEVDFIELTKDLDVDAFWAENARCQAFTVDKPRCSLSFSPDDHWLFEFMQVPSTLRYYEDKDYRDALHRETNRVTHEYVGSGSFPGQRGDVVQAVPVDVGHRHMGAPFELVREPLVGCHKIGADRRCRSGVDGRLFSRPARPKSCPGEEQDQDSTSHG